MGGMGRTYDGGYAEYTSVPVSQVVPFASGLDWATIGAIPEMLQTATGSLTIGLDAQPGQTLLIRGGTSSVGMAAATLAKRRGLTVLSTTRNAKKSQALETIGVDHVIIDTGTIAPGVRTILPDGVDAALELVGTPTLPDTLRATRIHGVVCFTGMLTRISDLAVVLYRQDQSPRLDFWGSDVRSHTTEGDTQWVNYKPSPFSSRSMAS